MLTVTKTNLFSKNRLTFLSGSAKLSSTRVNSTTKKMNTPGKVYFGIMRVVRYENERINAEWFIHFSFHSLYDGEEDCSIHDKDCWDAFWKLPAVNYDAICKGHFSSPSDWNYIRELKDVNTDGLHMGKWVQKSPFFREGRWQENPA